MQKAWLGLRLKNCAEFGYEIFPEKPKDMPKFEADY